MLRTLYTLEFRVIRPWIKTLTLRCSTIEAVSTPAWPRRINRIFCFHFFFQVVYSSKQQGFRIMNTSLYMNIFPWVVNDNTKYLKFTVRKNAFRTLM